MLATPIGNLGDITLRTLHALQNLDYIYSEDTRVTQTLLGAYGIRRKLLNYHDHNGAKVRPLIIQQITQGASVGLVSDAGTPLISDPGCKLVSAVIHENLCVFSFPGPCAAIAGLTVSGMATDAFRFCGFLPTTSNQRCLKLKALSCVSETLIFYETPLRLGAVLSDMHACFGSRQVCVARELTKRFEEVVRGSLDDVSIGLSTMTLKGEIVLIVAGCPDKETTPETIDATLVTILEKHSVKDASRLVAEMFARPRQEIYMRALKLKNVTS